MKNVVTMTTVLEIQFVISFSLLLTFGKYCWSFKYAGRRPGLPVNCTWPHATLPLHYITSSFLIIYLCIVNIRTIHCIICCFKNKFPDRYGISIFSLIDMYCDLYMMTQICVDYNKSQIIPIIGLMTIIILYKCI